MIDRHQLARACSENDRYAESGMAMSQALPQLGFADGDTGHVALQRALRLYAVMNGRKFESMTISDMHKLTDRERMLISAMAAAWIDGLAAAARALDAEGR